ncbi:MAG: SAM-dependent DNA methyltransferase [Candidatus Sabulitectum sp.]|nr:SAM-dependent DNA methyltransferase [Candidatus Sabulitectum sp.]
MKGLTIANGGDKSKRRKMDFYPTPPEATHALMKFLKLGPCLICEPACGDGAMAEVLKQYGHGIMASDLRQSGYGCGGVDFLLSDGDYDAIITNPPFNVSEEFIRHAIPQARVVAMILKSQYWHAKKRRKLFNEFPPAYVLPLTWRPDFGGGGSPTMEVTWTVWIEGEEDTRYRQLSKPLKV